MKKPLKDNLKKITALLLVGSMTVSLGTSAFAQEEITQDAIAREEIAQEEISQDESSQGEIVQEETAPEEISQEETTQDETVRDETSVEEGAQSNEADGENNNELTEEDSFVEDVGDIAYADLLDRTPESDEEARERESMPASDIFCNKLLKYLDSKYPQMELIDPDSSIDSHTIDYYMSKMEQQKVYKEIVIDGDDPDVDSEITDNMVQFKILGCFGNSIGSDENGQTIYNDTVKKLTIKNVDEIRNLYVPASVETLVIENTTLNCYQYPSDSPGFQSGMNPGDLSYCKNLKKLVLKDVVFGDNYKRGVAANRLPEITYDCPYETKYVLNLQNCHDLEELEIDVSFAGVQEVQLTINGGTENQFAKLTRDKCKINPAPGTGYGQVSLYANENSNLAKYYDSSETVKFKNERFRLWLLEALGVDANNDGVISQDELNAIDTLVLNDQTAHNAPQTSLSAFEELADIQLFPKLKTLELDFYDPNLESKGYRHSLKGIDFPGSLENLTLKNVYWEKDTETKSHDNADIILTNLKTLELYNTEVKTGSGDSYFDHPTQIELTDKDGVLKSCIIEKTDVKSIHLINNSYGKGIMDDDERQRIRFSAIDCQNLKTVEFSGEGYAVEGSLDLSNDKELTHIGMPGTTDEGKIKWTVLGEFDSTYAPVNVILNGCVALGSDCSELVIDYDFINGRDINVQTMNTSFDDDHKLTILRNPRIKDDKTGYVYLSCDEVGWVYTTYADKSGFVIEKRTSFPTIAVFANGQRARTEVGGEYSSSVYTADTRRWVERYDLVLPPGGYSANFGNLTFYVVDVENADGNSTEKLRRVFYKDDVYVEWENQNTENSIITLPTVEETGGYKLTGTKLSSTGIPGEVQLKLYVYDGNGDKSYIGFQDIKVFRLPDSVELVNDGTERGSGTKDDPFIIKRSEELKKSEELKLKARPLVNNQVDRSGDFALRDVYWRIKEYDETPKYTSDSDGYSLYTLDSATKAGISVVRGKLNEGESEAQYDRRVDGDTYYNHRRFTFDTAGSKFKIVAQVPYKNNDAVITKEVFVEYHSKSASIDVSNEIIQGKNGYEEATITIHDVYNRNSVDVNIKNPELYDDCFAIERDSSSVNGEESWKLRINSSDIVKVKNIINRSNGSLTLVIDADGDTYEERVNLSSVYPDASIVISNEIIQGKKGYEEATITIHDVYDISSVNVSIKNPELYDDCFAVDRDPSSADGEEIWKLRIKDCDAVKVKNIISKNNGILTLVVYADGRTFEENVNLSSVYPDSGKFWCADIEDQIYTGKAIQPKLEIYYGVSLLEEGKDYTVSYSNNINVASKTAVNAQGKKIAPSVTITGKGNYADKQIYYFSIVPCSIENAAKADDITVQKTGKDIIIKPNVVLDGKKLKQGRDYVVSTTTDERDSVVSLKDPADYSLYIVGKGNYSGALPFGFTITTSILASKAKIQKIANQNYNDGAEVRPQISIKYGGKDVTDCFDIRFEDNVEVGTATVIAKARKATTGEDYKGEAGYSFAGISKATFKINGLKINDIKLGASGKEKIPEFTYSGKENRPKPALYSKTDGTLLIENQDYTMKYSNNVNAGTATVFVKGKGKYTGTKKISFKINKYDAGKDSDGAITVNGNNPIIVPYEKGGARPHPEITMNGVVLTENKDYTLSYAQNAAVTANTAAITPTVTVAFKGNYSGKKSIPFTITVKDIATGTITLADKPVSANANAWKQTTVSIMDTNGKMLSAGTDYNGEFGYYRDFACTNAVTEETLAANTTVYVKVTGIKNYEGSYIVGSYRVSNINISTAKAEIDDKEYTGAAIYPSAEDVHVTVGAKNAEKTLTPGVDYEVIAGSDTNNTNTGMASVTIRGLGDYYGTKVVKYRINVNKILWWNW